MYQPDVSPSGLWRRPFTGMRPLRTFRAMPTFCSGSTPHDDLETRTDGGLLGGHQACHLRTLVPLVLASWKRLARPFPYLIGAADHSLVRYAQSVAYRRSLGLHHATLIT